MPYVDGFLLPVPRKKLGQYKKMARQAGKIWLEHGALQFRECMGDDLRIKGVDSFERAARAKSGETVMFSYIVFKSKADRDRVNKKVMADPRLDAQMKEHDPPPFDMKRMAYGGFKPIVDL